MLIKINSGYIAVCCLLDFYIFSSISSKRGTSNTDTTKFYRGKKIILSDQEILFNNGLEKGLGVVNLMLEIVDLLSTCILSHSFGTFTDCVLCQLSW